MKKLKTLLAILLIITPYKTHSKTNNINTLGVTTVISKKHSITSDSFENAEEKIKKIPGGVNIVKLKDRENSFSINFKDMLDYVPGVIAQPKAGQESRLSIRGSGLSRNYHLRGINLYQDGIPINLADGSADFQDIDNLAFDYIEVLKGGNALHLGSATLGGAINFVSPTGYNRDSLKLSIEGGSFGTVRGHISNAKVINNFDYFGSLTSSKNDGYRQQNQQSDTKLYSNFGYRFANNIENRTYLTIVNANLEMPGAISKTELYNDPKKANLLNLKNKQERNYNQFRIANKTSWLYDNININAGIYAVLKDLDHPIFQVIKQKTTNYGFFSDATIKNNILGYNSETLIGANLIQGNTDSKRYVNINGRAGQLTVDADEKSQNNIFYIQNNFYVDKKLTLVSGSQFIYSKRDYHDYFLKDGDQSGVKKYYGISPKIGAIYHIKKDYQLYTNLSGAYEPPTFNELRQTTANLNVRGLDNISAQKSYTLEIGTRQKNINFNWDFSVYRSHLRDELILYTIAPNITQAINSKKTIHQGVELSFDSDILSNVFFKDMANKIVLRNSYTFNDFRFNNDRIYGNNKIPGAPQHYIRLEIKYENLVGLYFVPNFEIVPNGFFIDSKNTIRSPNYWVFNLNTGYEINKNTLVYLDGRNLLNKKYSPTADVLSQSVNNDPAVYYPANSRSFFVGLKYKW
jgi:iron complex outermembrane receptor protein